MNRVEVISRSTPPGSKTRSSESVHRRAPFEAHKDCASSQSTRPEHPPDRIYEAPHTFGLALAAGFQPKSSHVLTEHSGICGAADIRNRFSSDCSVGHLRLHNIVCRRRCFLGHTLSRHLAQKLPTRGSTTRCHMNPTSIASRNCSYSQCLLDMLLRIQMCGVGTS